MPKLGATIGADYWSVSTDYGKAHGVILSVRPLGTDPSGPESQIELTPLQARQLARHLQTMAQDVDDFAPRG